MPAPLRRIVWCRANQKPPARVPFVPQGEPALPKAARSKYFELSETIWRFYRLFLWQ